MLTSRFQADAAPALRAGGSLADEFHARAAQRLDQFHQRIDIAANDAVARFHALNGRYRKARQFGELALIDAEECP